ncbi:RNase adapter RapZ [Aerococcaceae bacterium zg-ZUI334]|uniref:RNase adapter RapZ n=1 Tax=Aerococcaceae TaxID=186827 RepID=UPI0013B75446|nr:MULTISPECIES: RNase adapter RapZ [unclassified Facklamia]MBR7926757.1 RNase adapter RapZ [Aerococcaceae bacterium zg-ZUI334]MBS4461708.1 RNase adapter RapZ [Aerococcaceae bacterium zg-B36]QQD65340.1 RNase adapter RapZ [Aerococcaceae bacterium zg-252]NEW63996.1 RNase adapter RapZ [Facklamia sp. 252]NEW67467.1 RNase adapter RapZ [Facklamia sp. 253]
MSDALELVIITGMSGAGKTVAVQSFEDLGYYCVDNMPPSLLPTFWELIKESGKITKIALVIDLRSRAFFDELTQVISKMNNTQMITSKILFLEADDQVLVSRYKETRRNHPLAVQGRVSEGVHLEREMLRDLRSRAQVIINTSEITPRQLREQLMDKFAADNQSTFHVQVVSFGFKYGAPIDADVLMDVRFLPNPHYIDELRPKTGLDAEVYDYVMKQPETQVFYSKFIDLIEYCLPGYKKEGKSSVVIGIGCTGGQHRSIALAERVGNHLKNSGYDTTISHRDRFKKKESVVRS